MNEEIKRLLIRAAAFKEAANMVKPYVTPSTPQYDPNGRLHSTMAKMLEIHGELCIEEAKRLLSFQGYSYGPATRGTLPLS